MTKHEGFTPGPWRVCNDGRRIARGATIVADTTWAGAVNARCSSAYANARLIADAPNLYARVQELEAANERMRTALVALAYRLPLDTRTADGITKDDAALIACAALERK